MWLAACGNDGFFVSSFMAASTQRRTTRQLKPRTSMAVWFIRILFGLLCAMFFGWSDAALAYCSNGSFTVPAGGNYKIDLSRCAPGGLFGGTAPGHGRLLDDDGRLGPGGDPPYDLTGGNYDSVIYYVNNGDGALSDRFTIQDEPAHSVVFTVSVSPLPPVAGSVSATVADGSTANPITLSLSGGPATSVAVATGAAHGTATASGTGISYTPTAGYAGSDSFTYTATNTSGTSSPATVRLTIGPPTQTITPSSSWSAVDGVSYSQTLAWSGGATPYSGYSVSGLPAGVTATNGNNSMTISGTPGAVGSFSVTVSAIDNSTGSGPFIKSQIFTLTVSAPSVILTPAASTLNGGYNTAYAQTFAASGGVAPYTYVLSGGLPTGLNFNASTATLSGTPTVSGNFPISVTATDHSTGSGAPFSGTVSYTLAIAAPSITLVPGSLSGGTVAASYSASITGSGGAAPYTYNLTSGALPVGLTLNAASGTLSGTPIAGGTYNFIVRALDVNNASGTQAYSLPIAAPTVTLTPSTLSAPTAETAYGATLTAAGGTGPYSFLVVSGALPSGLTLNASTGVLSGTTNQSGSFNVTIRATDSSTGTGPFSGTQAYSLTSAAPTISLAPGAMTAGRVNVAYSGQLTASGGTAPYVMTLTSGSLPTGLVLSNAGVVSGTPTTAGNATFTVNATDAHGFAGQQVVILIVGQPQPVAINDVAITAANQAVTVNVTANDSGPVSSIAITNAPSHGTATVSGVNVVYTPSLNYFGSDSLSYTDTGAGGTSAPATVTVTVTALAVPTATAQNATILAGQPVTIHGATGAGNGPFTALTIVSPPATGTAIVSGTDMVYTSSVGGSGNVSFTFTLTNAFGVSAPATVTIHLNPIPIAVARSATVLSGNNVMVDLTTGASGAPFNAASIMTVTPSTAGTAVIRIAGTVYQMSFTAAAKFTGAATVSYTLSNAYATSAPGNVGISVSARPDMAVNPEVTGLLAAQADSARRFSLAQLSNFTRRLESLHADGWGHSGFDVSVPMTPSGQPTTDSLQGSNSAFNNVQARNTGYGGFDDLTNASYQPNMRKTNWSQPTSNSGGLLVAANNTGMASDQLPDLPARQNDTHNAQLSMWIGGAVDFGQQHASGQQTGFKFNTDGVTVGGDYRINDMATIGLGAGLSRSNSDIGDNGSKSAAESVVAAVYGSLRPMKNVYIDGVFGLGTLNFNSTRYMSDGSGFANGMRNGNHLFTAIVAGKEFRNDGWMWTPYGRVELTSATLNQYTETAPGTGALTYFRQTVRNSSATLGARVEGRYVTTIGTWVPRARVEFAHQFQNASNATMAYADQLAEGPAYTVQTTALQTGNWATGVGTRLFLHNGFICTIDYNTNINQSSGRNQAIIVGLEVPLR